MKSLLNSSVFFCLLLPLLLQQVHGSPRGGQGGDGHWTGRGFQSPFQRRQRRFCSFLGQYHYFTGRGGGSYGGSRYYRSLGGRPPQWKTLPGLWTYSKSVEEIAVHQRVGGKALACYSLFQCEHTQWTHWPSMLPSTGRMLASKDAPLSHIVSKNRLCRVDVVA